MCFKGVRMLRENEIDEIFQKLSSWCMERNYEGYDPYDWWSSPIANKLSYKLNFIMSQINIYSPINLRRFFGIEKGKSNKALTLFLQAYLNYCLIKKNSKYLNEARKLLSILEKRKIKSDKGIGWASYYFKFVRKEHILSPNQVDIIATSEALKAYSLAYNLFKEQKYKIMADEITKIIFSTFVGKYKEMRYIKYFPSERGKIAFNVSGLVLSSFSYYLEYVHREELMIKIGEELVKFLINNQRMDGAWPYSYYIDENRYKYQIDYHQGFILDGLLQFLPYVSSEGLRKKMKKSILLGLKFYKNKQFHPSGYAYYRLPLKYPIDIHNQAQGIITFSKAYKVLNEKSYLDFAMKIAEWTIKNMLSPEGYFYTHRWPFMINKIPYMRWGQAWMLLALSSLLKELKEGKE